MGATSRRRRIGGNAIWPIVLVVNWLWEAPGRIDDARAWKEWASNLTRADALLVLALVIFLWANWDFVARWIGGRRSSDPAASPSDQEPTPPALIGIGRSPGGTIRRVRSTGPSIQPIVNIQDSENTEIHDIERIYGEPEPGKPPDQGEERPDD